MKTEKDMVRGIARFIEQNADKITSTQYTDTWICEKLDLRKILFDDGYTLCVSNNELLIYIDYANTIRYNRGTYTELEKLYKQIID